MVPGVSGGAADGGTVGSSTKGAWGAGAGCAPKSRGNGFFLFFSPPLREVFSTNLAVIDQRQRPPVLVALTFHRVPVVPACTHKRQAYKQVRGGAGANIPANRAIEN